MSLSDPMPAAWLAHAFTISEKNLPACNKIDRSENLPRCRVVPVADRLLEELIKNGRVDVRGMDNEVFTVRAKVNKKHGGVVFAIYQGKVEREPFRPMIKGGNTMWGSDTLLGWFSRLRPVLRVVRGRP